MSDLTSEQRRILVLIFSVTLTSIMGNSLLSPVIPNVLDEFGKSDGSAGFLVAATSLPGIVIAPVAGVLADRYGRRRVLVPCLALFGTAGSFVAGAPTFETMLLGRFVMGFGAAALINLAVVLISDHFPGDRRTYWVGKNAGVLTLALAVFPVIAGLIADVAGWRWALSPYGFGLVTAVFAWRILDPTPPDVGRTFRGQIGGVGEAVRNPVLLATFAGAATSFAIVFGAFLTVLPNHLENEFGLSAGQRGLIIGLPALTSSMSAFNLGRISRIIPAGRLLIGAAAMWIASFLMIGLTGALVVLAFGTLLYGFADGVLIPSLQDTALSNAPAEHRAAVMSTWTAFGRLGQTVGPLLSGVIIAGGSTSAALVAGSVASIGMLAVFAATPLGRIR